MINLEIGEKVGIPDHDSPQRRIGRGMLARRISALLGCLAMSMMSLFGVQDRLYATHICTYDEETKTVTVETVIEDSVLVSVGRAGVIKVDRVPCGTATRFNTDIIDLTTNSPGSQFVRLRAMESDFAPGFTDEPGDSDEIEFDLDLSVEDRLDFDAGRVADVRVGSVQPTGVTRLNLNADETNGVDADVLIDAAVHEVFLAAGRRGRPARFDASGGAGTGDHYAGRTSMAGSNEDDVLIGGLRLNRILGLSGSDHIRGNDSRDRVRAALGRDVIFGAGANDKLVGGSRRDEIHGGDGDDVVVGNHDDDRLFGGEGTDRLEGGEGSDVCTGGAGNDDFVSCEEHD